MNTENNKLIAEFMNCENPQAWEDDLYSNDWNWLMEVVEKIESLGYNTKIESLEHTRVSIGNGKYLTLVEVDNETKIEAVYNACIEFIKWYNLNLSINNK